MENELEARVMKRVKMLEAALLETNTQLRRLMSFLPQSRSSSYVRKTDIIDHGALSGLISDDHTQYLLLAGRAGGQTAIGGTAANDDITFQTSAHATKGSYIFSEMVSAGYLKNTAAGVVTGGNLAIVVLNLEIFTDTNTLDSVNDVVICNKATAMTINLPVASGSAKQYYIKSIGAGVVTVTPNGADTIDGEVSQALNQWDSMVVVDYVSNKWVIV